ncbi:MAG: beta-ketoacyl synthase chain length factor [Campylobacteraceae bacterium]|jgi:hypothetical protein|nr:beta-ketoacyl synthase chain length factor [Campylobacteraceae bacterium]
MTISLEISKTAALFAEKRVEDLREKELTPNMMLRRRLTRNAKMLIFLADKLGVKNERIVYGSNYGELKESISILENIFAHTPPSPTDFQNSVYNTPSAYYSILSGNTSEILCVSNGDETGVSAIKTAAIKSLDGDEIFLVLCESFDIEELRALNSCGAMCESAVAFILKKSELAPDIYFDALKPAKQFVPSTAQLMSLHNFLQENPKAIIGITC